MSWVKEAVGAREHGFRRDDNLAYVGKSASGWWRAYVRLDVEDSFELITRRGIPNAEMAKGAADELLEGLVAA